MRAFDVWAGSYLQYVVYIMSLLAAPRVIHSFPTRRSSDLSRPAGPRTVRRRRPARPVSSGCSWRAGRRDRKSTRLNSSHLGISYAVFFLKKKRRALGVDVVGISALVLYGDRRGRL